ncbi:hypothetical protein [Methylacidimicrobium sp. B4]|uniref:hypothetical protein n=1 Tax=Methylacidimicrobium sp. B4 TaxID=2796139 RepID=UPI001A9035E2|nr:hypothetical protein [Methylacidimicrobium sp. B4]QSR84697.1 hypothetical protein MacB4_11000 [Methylacidimicrobium sp. B4]
MSIYTTPPARPYVIIGLIGARNGLFGSPRTRAVAMAKKVGADALILLGSDRFVTGTTGNWSGTQQQQTLGNSSYGTFGGTASSQVHYSVSGYYAAIQWSRAAPPQSNSNGTAGNGASDRVERALPAQAGSP